MGKAYSFYLFAQPSFFSGMASVLDMGGTLTAYNEQNTADKADSAALAADWKAVGEDIKNSIRNYEQAHPTEFKRSTNVNKAKGSTNHS